MRRREFILGLGGAATWPLLAHAQQPKVPVIGFFRSSTAADSTTFVKALQQGLQDAGFVTNQNVAVEYFFAENQRDRLSAIGGELVNRKVSVIVGDAVAMLAAKAVTKDIPIVFAVGGDPVEQGLVDTLNRPGGNVTGVHFFAGVLGAKRLELLTQVMPTATKMGFLIHPATPNTEAERKDVVLAAQSLAKQLVIVDVNSAEDILPAFTALIERGAAALLVGSGPFTTSYRRQIVELAARHSLPAIYHVRESVISGGLMSYGTSVAEGYRQAGTYVARILKGEKPGDLPVVRSTKFDFVLNLNTAKALGITIPSALLATADEVIE